MKITNCPSSLHGAKTISPARKLCLGWTSFSKDSNAANSSLLINCKVNWITSCNQNKKQDWTRIQFQNRNLTFKSFCSVFRSSLSGSLIKLILWATHVRHRRSGGGSRVACFFVSLNPNIQPSNGRSASPSVITDRSWRQKIMFLTAATQRFWCWHPEGQGQQFEICCMLLVRLTRYSRASKHFLKSSMDRG